MLRKRTHIFSRKKIKKHIFSSLKIDNFVFSSSMHSLHRIEIKYIIHICTDQAVNSSIQKERFIFFKNKTTDNNGQYTS